MCYKAIAVSEKHQTELSFWQNMESLIQSGSAELCGVMNQDSSCILMLQRGVFEDLARNTIVNASLPQFGGRGVIVWGAISAAGTGELLHCAK